MITPYVLLMPHLVVFIGDKMIIIVNIFVWKAQLTVALWSSHISRCAPFPYDSNNYSIMHGDTQLTFVNECLV